MNREQLRYIQKLPRDKFFTWLSAYAKESYTDGFGDGVERNILAMMRYLHDEFGWGNTRFSRLIELARKDVEAMQEGRVTTQEFRDGLAAEGCTCLKNLQLKGDPPVDRWIPVTEKLPDDDQKVLCCKATKSGKKTLAIGYYSKGLWCGTSSTNTKIIAWRILPPVYEERKE